MRITIIRYILLLPSPIKHGSSTFTLSVDGRSKVLAIFRSISHSGYTHIFMIQLAHAPIPPPHKPLHFNCWVVAEKKQKYSLDGNCNSFQFMLKNYVYEPFPYWNCNKILNVEYEHSILISYLIFCKFPLRILNSNFFNRIV